MFFIGRFSKLKKYKKTLLLGENVGKQQDG